MKIFKNTAKIKFEGTGSQNPLTFNFYNENRGVFGKTMKEHLSFSMVWWHNLCAADSDMLGRGTANKSLVRSTIRRSTQNLNRFLMKCLKY